MTMTMDQQHRQLGFDHMQYSAPGPQFTNPWASTSSANSTHLFSTALGSNNNGFEALAKQAARASGASMPYTPSTSAPSIGTTGNYSNGTYGQDLLNLSQDLSNAPRSTYDQAYSTAPASSTNSYAPVSAPYNLGTYTNLSQPQQPNHARRVSPQNSSSASQSQSTFGDALDASRGMLAMSQDLTTPRNIYGPRSDADSTDSYGFPASHSSTHSSHSSISSGSTYPSYYSSSVDGSSVSDYSSQSDSMESISSRTLPRPSGLIHSSLPPAPPQSMMGQFNSKISSSTQKKHKCKVCDKRFTRPSSLQTHMYSHTGEKPYACEADGCGRHFSVVSNLRRHRKVHKSERSSDHGSPEGSWVSEKSSTTV
ncbi:hypothetical protein MMC07_009499 [Pseudocyphellaria aurata]|nr:hypothetical protein [Pseudocyphellaria aurata]